MAQTEEELELETPDTEHTLAEWEDLKDIIVVGVTEEQLSTTMSRDRFEAITVPKIACNHESRIAFLEANGYAVTRENMYNGNLSVLQNDLWES